MGNPILISWAESPSSLHSFSSCWPNPQCRPASLLSFPAQCRHGPTRFPAAHSPPLPRPRTWPSREPPPSLRPTLEWGAPAPQDTRRRRLECIRARLPLPRHPYKLHRIRCHMSRLSHRRHGRQDGLRTLAAPRIRTRATRAPVPFPNRRHRWCAPLSHASPSPGARPHPRRARHSRAHGE